MSPYLKKKPPQPLMLGLAPQNGFQIEVTKPKPKEKAPTPLPVSIDVTQTPAGVYKLKINLKNTVLASFFKRTEAGAC